MPHDTVCRRLTWFERFRVTLIDTCGVPIPGEDNGWVEDCVISVQSTPNIQQGNDFAFDRANGTSCGFVRGRPSKRGADVTLTWWTASPGLIALMTGAQPIVVDNVTIGWQDCEDDVGRFALETWQATEFDDCGDDDTEPYAYRLWPYLDNVVFSPPQAVGNQSFQLQVSGNTRTGAGWDVGPYDVVNDAGGVPGPLPDPVGDGCHFVYLDTTVPPPDGACGFAEVPGS